MKIEGDRVFLERSGRMWLALAVAVLAAGLALAALAPRASAADSVQPGRTIEAFIGTDLVNVQGYPANTQVTIEVLRRGILIGSATGMTDAEGFLEVNHAGGGPFPLGDCFEGDATPDVRAGDVVRVRTASDPAGVFDSAVVRDLGVNFDTITTNVNAGTITISGHVRSRPNALIAPGTDVLELRLNKATRDNTWETGPGLDQDRPGRRDLRVDIGANVRANGTWARVLNVGTQDARDWQNNPGEVSLEWSEGAGEENPPAIFVADEAGGEAIAGCPPLAQYGVTATSPRAINQAFIAGDAPFVVRGTSFNANAVSVTINDRNSATNPRVVAATLSQESGHQTWRAEFANARLGGLSDGPILVSAVYTVNRDVFGAAVTPANFGGTNLPTLKDTVVPRAPVATPPPGVYNRPISVSLAAERGAVIRFTVDGSRPTLGSRQFVRPIRVTGTQRIKAVAFDAAGNRSPLGSFRYVIR
jgi:hypothetical protein